MSVSPRAPIPAAASLRPPETATPRGTAPILVVEGLVKVYGKRRVVDGVSFYVNPGEVVGLLGPNGAGKTTSFRMACGLIKTNGGVVYLNGQDVTNFPMYRRSLDGGMGYLPQAESVFRNLSVQDNILSVMELLGVPRAARIVRCEDLLEKFHLTHLRRNLGGGLSGGERRRLEIARALVSSPRIMLLDEPFANIDPITVHSIQDIIRQLARDGIAVLITDHQVRETLQITRRGYIIREGQVLCHGTPEEILANSEARKVYFGEDIGVNEFSGGGKKAGVQHGNTKGHRTASPPPPPPAPTTPTLPPKPQPRDIVLAQQPPTTTRPPLIEPRDALRDILRNGGSPPTLTTPPASVVYAPRPPRVPSHSPPPASAHHTRAATHTHHHAAATNSSAIAVAAPPVPAPPRAARDPHRDREHYATSHHHHHAHTAYHAPPAVSASDTSDAPVPPAPSHGVKTSLWGRVHTFLWGG